MYPRYVLSQTDVYVPKVKLTRYILSQTDVHVPKVCTVPCSVQGYNIDLDIETEGGKPVQVTQSLLQ